MYGEKGNFLHYLNNFSILNGFQMQTRLLDTLLCFWCSFSGGRIFLILCTFLLLISSAPQALFRVLPLHFYLVFTFRFKIVEFSDKVRVFKGRVLHNLRATVTSEIVWTLSRVCRTAKRNIFFWWNIYGMLCVIFSLMSTHDDDWASHETHNDFNRKKIFCNSLSISASTLLIRSRKKLISHLIKLMTQCSVVVKIVQRPINPSQEACSFSQFNQENSIKILIGDLNKICINSACKNVFS